MKTKTSRIQKVRVRNNLEDVYYTKSDWPQETIEGETFIYVVKDCSKMTQPKKMRKDALEYLR